MTGHRFEIGERVTYSEKRFPMGTWTIELVVVEQLTADEGPEYRLQDQHWGTEYLLAEHELDPWSGDQQKQRSQPSPWAA